MLFFRRVEDADQRLALATDGAELEVIERDAGHDRFGAALEVFDRHVGEVLLQETLYF